MFEKVNAIQIQKNNSDEKKLRSKNINLKLAVLSSALYFLITGTFLVLIAFWQTSPIWLMTIFGILAWIMQITVIVVSIKCFAGLFKGNESSKRLSFIIAVIPIIFLAAIYFIYLIYLI